MGLLAPDHSDMLPRLMRKLRCGRGHSGAASLFITACAEISTICANLTQSTSVLAAMMKHKHIARMGASPFLHVSGVGGAHSSLGI